jgi:hypothetical protein
MVRKTSSAEEDAAKTNKAIIPRNKISLIYNKRYENDIDRMENFSEVSRNIIIIP